MSEALNISSSPHVRDRWTTPYIMRVVLLSLMPATCVGIIAYGWHTPVFWPGEFHGLYSPCGLKESERTEQLSLFTFILL